MAPVYPFTLSQSTFLGRYTFIPSFSSRDAKLSSSIWAFSTISGGKGLLGLNMDKYSSGMVALIICSGSDGNAEFSARPTMTALSGDHSLSADMRGAFLGDIVSLCTGECL